MKIAKNICFIAGLALTVSLLVLSFYGNTNAQQTSGKDCLSACSAQKKACFNINPDKMLCEKEYQACVKACEKTVEPASTPVKEPKNEIPVMY